MQKTEPSTVWTTDASTFFTEAGQYHITFFILVENFECLELQHPHIFKRNSPISLSEDDGVQYTYIMLDIKL